MAVIKCKMCGGDLSLTEGSTIAECEYCGSVQTVPSADSEKKLALFARANRLRAANEFDKAAGVYETIVADFPEEPEAYWGLVLCRFGIEYVDDPASGKKIPTCHRSGFDSVMDDKDFELVLEYSDSASRRIYREEAKRIEELRRGIIEVSGKEEPYDIFICYKETSDSGERTLDSVLAQDVYDRLVSEGYRVFFSRVTLEDKLGVEYEPYIFAALNSAKIMLAFGTDYEYFNAVWVKNEWSRWLKLMEKDKSKHLIPCYKNIDAYDMPKEFAKLQSQDLGKVGAMQDLLRGIRKLLPKEAPKEPERFFAGGVSPVEPLLKRSRLFLEDEDFKSADEYAERVLDADPENAEAYLLKLAAELRLKRTEDLALLKDPIENNKNYIKALRYGSPAFRSKLESCAAAIRERNLRERTALVYSSAEEAMKTAASEEEFLSIAEKFRSVSGFKDADALEEECRRKAQEKRYAQMESVYSRAESLCEYRSYDYQREAARLFRSVSEYRDSAVRAEECGALADRLEAEERMTAIDRKKREELLPRIKVLEQKREVAKSVMTGPALGKVLSEIEKELKEVKRELKRLDG